MKKILIRHRDFVAEGEINEDMITSQELLDMLPLENTVERYLQELYMDVGLKFGYENPVTQTEAGDIAYWPPGRAFCVFHGDSQPVNEVNIIGKVVKGLEDFTNVKKGDKLKLEIPK